MNIEIDPAGIVTNDGEKLGVIKDGVCHLVQQCAPTVKGEIRKVNGNAELKFSVGEAPDSEDAPEVETIPPSSAPSAPVPAVSAGMPERDPVLGDKCPKLIAWKSEQKGGK